MTVKTTMDPSPQTRWRSCATLPPGLFAELGGRVCCNHPPAGPAGRVEDEERVFGEGSGDANDGQNDNGSLPANSLALLCDPPEGG